MKTQIKSNRYILAAAILSLPMMLTAAAPPRFAWLANDPANTYDAATLAGIRDITGLVHATVDPFYAGFDGPTQLAQCRQALASRPV